MWQRFVENGGFKLTIKRRIPVISKGYLPQLKLQTILNEKELSLYLGIIVIILRINF